VLKKEFALTKTHYNYLFLAGLVICFWAAQVWQSLPLPPQSIHISAQCDRGSIAQNFYEDNMNILMPHINNMERGTGIAAAEFPLIPFLAACFYKLFGFHNFWFRLVTFLFFTLGFIFSKKLALLLSQNEMVSFFVSMLWLCSPTLLYYIPNFNPDPAALGMIMIAWYYFFLWQKKQNWLYAGLIGVSSSLAVLMKASTAISVVAMIVLLICDLTGRLGNKNKKHFPNKLYLVAAFAFSVGISLGWYRYAKGLNEAFFSGFFTLEARIPQNIDQINSIWINLKTTLFPHYYSKQLIWLIIFLHAFILIRNKNVPRQLLLLTWALGLGSLAFIFLMFVAFEHHDYYIIALLPWIFFLFLSSGIAISESIQEKKIKKILVSLCSLLLIYNIAYCYLQNKWLYNRHNQVYYQPPFDGFYDAEPSMRQAGIQRNDFIISLTDPSYDVTLYLMNQKGYTIADKKDINRIFSLLISWKAKYVVTNTDDCLPDLPVVKKFLGKPILVHKNLKFYKPKLEDTSLVNRIHHIIHLHINRQIPFFINDPATVRYNESFCKATGATLDGVLHNACLYQFKITEQSLENALKEFAVKEYHTPQLSAEIRNAFANKNNLSEFYRYVLQHPYNSWFDQFN
jgi:hypothetical protein